MSLLAIIYGNCKKEIKINFLTVEKYLLGIKGTYRYNQNGGNK